MLDAAGCVVAAGPQRWIAFVQDVPAFDEDCRRATVIDTRLKAPATCTAHFLLNGDGLSTRGATTIRFTPEAVEVMSVKKGRERLPWLDLGKSRAGTLPARERPR
jgi:competence protein ComEC